MELSTLRTLLIDGDGVLWRGSSAVPGLDRFTRVLQARGINWALLTNNSTTSPASYRDKLAGFGVEHPVEAIFTSSTVTVSYLKEHYAPGAPLYVVGMAGLIGLLRDAGFTVYTGETEPEHVVAVVSGLDREITYERLRIASNLIREGADFIATNNDSSFPGAHGLSPGAGAIIAALEVASGRRAHVMGKPDPVMYRVAMDYFRAEASTTAMLGDRLDTDLLGAKTIGIGRIMVLSGVGTQEDIERGDHSTPDLVYPSILELAEALERA